MKRGGRCELWKALATGNAKMADWLFDEFGQQGRRFQAGQFRLLAERETKAAWSWSAREPSNGWTTRTWTNEDFGELSRAAQDDYLKAKMDLQALPLQQVRL